MTTMLGSNESPGAARIRRVVGAGVFAAAMAFAASPFGHPAVARADYNDADFESCMNRNMPTDYCCEHAGGVMRNGACVDPATLRVQGPVQTSPTRRPLPPGVAPPATAVNPGNAG
jgi:hypothetical protein